MPRRILGLGEPASRVAFRAGFRRTDSLWNEGANAALRERRANPEVLARGDELFVPEHETKNEPAETSARHTFRIRRGALFLRVTLRQWDHRAFASEMVEIEGVAALGNSVDTDPDGTVRARIHPLEDAVHLTVRGGPLDLRVGHLEPIETAAGVRARLANLGYLLGRVDDEDDDLELWFALQDFQADAEINLSGQADAATLTLLQDHHGS